MITLNILRMNALKKIKLTIPTIDLLECKKFKGGYDQVYPEGTIYTDENYDEETGGYHLDLEETIVRPQDDSCTMDDMLDIENDSPENDNEYDQHEDRNETDADQDTVNITVRVEDGQCSIGGIASAIQLLYGTNATTAIAQAESAMTNAGINLTVDPETNLITFNWGQLFNALSEYFQFTEFSSLASDPNRWDTLTNWFNDGNCALLMYDEHIVYATDYENGIFTYYDATTGEISSIVGGLVDELILLGPKATA